MRTILSVAILLLPLALDAAELGCANTLPPAQLQTCSQAQADKAQQRLDGLMKELRKSSTAKNWEYLKTSQILWEKSRAYDCRVEASFEGIALQTSVRYQCEAWYSRERMHQLRYVLCPRYWQSGQCDVEKDYE